MDYYPEENKNTFTWFVWGIAIFVSIALFAIVLDWPSFFRGIDPKLSSDVIKLKEKKGEGIVFLKETFPRIAKDWDFDILRTYCSQAFKKKFPAGTRDSKLEGLGFFKSMSKPTGMVKFPIEKEVPGISLVGNFEFFAEFETGPAHILMDLVYSSNDKKWLINRYTIKSITFVGRQQIRNEQKRSLGTPYYDAFQENKYVNHFLGFAFPIPEGWEILKPQYKIFGTDRALDFGLSKVHTRYVSLINGYSGAVRPLLSLKAPSEYPFKGKITISAEETMRHPRYDKAEVFFDYFSTTLINKSRGKLKKVGEEKSVEMAGLSFASMDLEVINDDYEGVVYQRIFGTMIGNHYLAFTITTDTKDQLSELEEFIFNLDST